MASTTDLLTELFERINSDIDEFAKNLRKVVAAEARRFADVLDDEMPTTAKPKKKAAKKP